MIVILDPALLLTASAQGPLAPDEENELSEVVDDVARICRTYRARIPDAEWYWSKLQTDFVRPLRKRTSGPRLRQGLEKWQQYAASLTLAGMPTTGKTRLWGVTTLFRWPRLPVEWFGIMERLLIGCAQINEPTVLVTRLFAGRNMQQTAVKQSVLTAKTRWRLYLHVPGQPPKHVPCVRNPRNLDVPWTARFDEKLPDTGSYPFCPPKGWWRRHVQAHATLRSKPAWVDRYGNGWVQPATGGDYHWDLFIEDPNQHEAVGLDAINVVAWGNPEKGKTPGEIHHTSKKKEGRFRGGGWTCPGDP